MARVPLEELVLQIHLLGLGPAADFLARVIEPPPAKSITGAVSQLQAIGALTPEEGFTPLGDLSLYSPCAVAISCNIHPHAQCACGPCRCQRLCSLPESKRQTSLNFHQESTPYMQKFRRP